MTASNPSARPIKTDLPQDTYTPKPFVRDMSVRKPAKPDPRSDLAKACDDTPPGIMLWEAYFAQAGQPADPEDRHRFRTFAEAREHLADVVPSQARDTVLDWPAECGEAYGGAALWCREKAGEPVYGYAIRRLDPETIIRELSAVILDSLNAAVAEDVA